VNGFPGETAPVRLLACLLLVLDPQGKKRIRQPRGHFAEYQEHKEGKGDIGSHGARWIGFHRKDPFWLESVDGRTWGIFRNPAGFRVSFLRFYHSPIDKKTHSGY
jgi:hypothetical protein